MIENFKKCNLHLHGPMHETMEMFQVLQMWTEDSSHSYVTCILGKKKSVSREDSCLVSALVKWKVKNTPGFPYEDGTKFGCMQYCIEKCFISTLILGWFMTMIRIQVRLFIWEQS